MILVDNDIWEAMHKGDIVISPFDAASLGTNSYDVRLARTLLTYKLNRIHTEQTILWNGTVDNGKAIYHLDCKTANDTEETIIPDEGIILMPGVLYLASTQEYTETHSHVPFLEGKSSLGRLGLNIHVTAGKGDVGFCGHWTMEMTVVHPLKVYAGMKIGQLIYHSVSSQPHVDYGKKSSQKYAAQHTKSDDPKPVASRMYRNFESGQ